MPAGWLAVLIDVALKGTFILAGAGLLAAALKKRSAAVRHLVWSVAVGALLALPLFCAILPAWRIPVLPAEVASPGLQGAASQGRTDPDEGRTAAVSPASAESGSTQPSRGSSGQKLRSAAGEGSAPGGAGGASPWFPSRGWAVWVLAAWAVGGVFAVASLLVGTVGMWRLVSKARPAESSPWRSLKPLLDALSGSRTRLRESDSIRVPVTWGVVRPVVLMPSWARGWPEEKKRIALLHEVAHLRRLDCLTQMLAQLACGLYWFHPLVWLAARRMRIEREQACDDHVLDTGLDPSNYAEHLLDIARSARRYGGGAVAAVFMAHRSSLEGRLLAILDPERPRLSLRPSLVLASIVLATVLILPLAALRAGPRSAFGGENAARAERIETSTCAGTLPNGSRVELLGVSFHPSRGRQWWAPDGTPLGEPPYVALAGVPELERKAGTRWMEVALRVQGPADSGYVTYCETLPSTEATGAQARGPDGRRLREIEGRLFRIPESLESITVRYAVSGGDWDTAAVTRRGGTTTEYKDGQVSFSHPLVKEGSDREASRTGIVVTDTLVDDLPRILAIDHGGSAHLPAIRENLRSPPNERATRAWFPELLPEDIREFRFQVRPYEWVVFRNVSLEPGGETDVQVNVRGEAGENPLPKPTFGPVLQRTIKDEGDGEDAFMDLDTGELLTPPSELSDDMAALAEWAEKHGADLTCGSDDGVRGLAGFQVAVDRVGDDLWTDAAPQSLQSIESLRDALPDSAIHMNAKGELPKTFAFHTREGTTVAPHVRGPI